MNRRSFLVGLSAMSLARRAESQYVPVRRGTVSLLFKAPGGHPNALDATPEGLWCGDQISDTAFLLDWHSGSVLKKVATESSNTSAIAFGGGYLWMGANGGPTSRKPRPDEQSSPRILKVDPEDGRTVGVFPTPDKGAIKGMLYADDSLWVTSYVWNTITRLDPDTMEVKHKFPLQLPSAHGIAWDPPGIWILYQQQRLFMKQDVDTGKVLDIVSIRKDVDLVPHGIAVHNGLLYCCDAGLQAGPFGDLPDDSPTAGYVGTVNIAAARR